MQLFYAPEINEGNFTLPPDEAHHCLHVLRHRQGDAIWIIDGKGGLYKAIITQANPKNCSFSIEQKEFPDPIPAVNLHMAVALTKNADRWEWFVEKATEIGVSSITPLLSARTERKHLRTERLNKILITAVKQSVKATVPVLNPLIDFASFIKTQQINPGAKYIAYIDDNNQTLSKVYTKGTNATMLIGPEGDFSPDEVNMAIAAQYQPVSLGKSRLRTETAAISVCQTIALLNELNSYT